MNTKIRLLQLGKKQVDLLAILQKNGYPKLGPETLSKIINRHLNTPLAYQVRENVDKILTEWENEKEE